MAKKTADTEAPTATRLTKGELAVETTIPAEVAELRAHGFSVADEKKSPATPSSNPSSNSSSSSTTSSSSSSSGNTAR